MMYLNGKAAKHSKSIDLMKSEKCREKYLDDERVGLSNAQLLFKLRTRMIPVKTNFPAMWNNDVACRTCKSTVEIESQTHLLKCTGIREFIDIPESLCGNEMILNIVDVLIVLI